VLSRIPHIGIDEQRTLAELRKQRGKIRRDPTATFTALGTRNRNHFATRGFEPTKNQLTSHRTQWLENCALRLVGGNQVVGDPILAPTREYRVMELLRQGKIDIALREQLKLQRGVTESKPVGLGKALNLIRVNESESPVLN
jgi:hypothetical protein